MIKQFSFITLFVTFATSSVQANDDYLFDENLAGKEIHCLALNIYFEARSEDKSGQFAVAAVTMNRVASDKFPDTVCKVVWQRRQFSWTHDGKSDKPREKQAWNNALTIASTVYRNYFEFQKYSNGAWDITRGALHYYAPDIVKPYWARDLKNFTKIGNHVFVATSQ